MKRSDDFFLEMNRLGWIPGPEESEEAYVKRLYIGNSIEEWSKCSADLRKQVDIAPRSFPIFYSNEKLTPWQGAMSWIYEERGVIRCSIQLRKGKINLEALAHEAIHAARAAFDEPKWEEALAYLVSKKKWRRFLGPIVEKSWEAWLFLGALIAGDLGWIFSESWLSFGPVALVMGSGMGRLLSRQWRLRWAAKRLEELVGEEKEAVLVRLRDREIELFSRSSKEEIGVYITKQKCLRWRVLRLAYF